MKINPGNHFARIADYGFVASQAGEPLAFIVFQFKDQDQVCHLTWRGSFKEGRAREITLKALMLCSNKIQRGTELVPSFVVKGIDAMADGKASLMLDTENEVSITVEYEVNPKDGKAYPRIKWINQASGMQQRLMSRDDVRVKFAGMQIGGDIIKLGQEASIKLGHEASIKHASPLQQIRQEDLEALPF